MATNSLPHFDYHGNFSCLVSTFLLVVLLFYNERSSFSVLYYPQAWWTKLREVPQPIFDIHLLHKFPPVPSVLLPVRMFIPPSSPRRAIQHGHYHSGLSYVDVEGPQLSTSISLCGLLSAVLHILQSLPDVPVRSIVRRMASSFSFLHVPGYLTGQPVHHLLGCLPEDQEH